MAPESAQQSESGSELSGENTHSGEIDRASDAAVDNLYDIDAPVVVLE